MGIKEFIESLRKINFSLEREDDKLILKSEKNVGQQEILAIKKNEFVINYIKENKQRLIEYLSLSAQASPDKKSKDISSIYRLSPLQEGMMFHGLYDPGSGVYIEQFACDLIGLRVDDFIKSWAHVLKMHSILRSSFYYAEFNVPVQCVFRQVTLPVKELDYRSMPRDQQQEAIREFAEADRLDGFDFKVAPLMRVTLFRLSDDSYRMLWTYHHILVDGWSMPILMQELLTAYDSIADGEQLTLTEEDLYEDYIRYLERYDKQKEEEYWRNNMQGLENASLLPFLTITNERNKGSGLYKSMSLKLNSEATLKIRKYVQQNRLTLNSVTQGVWAYLLHRYTGNTNVVFGVIVSGRPDELPNIEKRVGLYINNLPIHVSVSGAEGVNNWIQKIQSEQVSSRQYQHTPLQQIQKWAGIQGDMFDTLLVFENYPIGELLTSKQWRLKVENTEFKDQTNYPLNVFVTTGDEIEIRLLYNSDLLEEPNAGMILGHFEHVLIQMADNGGTLLNQIHLLTPSEEIQLISEFNNTTGSYSRDKTIIHLFEEQVANTPEAIAVVFEAKQLTYQELNEKADHLAGYLRSKGVEKGTLVSVYIERSLEMIVGIFAVLKANGAYIPLDPDFPPDRIRYMLEDSGASTILSSKSSAPGIRTAGNFDVIEIDGYWPPSEKQALINVDTRPDPQDLAYVIYTSGSTGKPKGVMIEHRSLVNFLTSMKKHVQINSDSALLSVTTFSFDICYLEFFLPLISGARLIIVPREVAMNGNELVRSISSNRVTHLQATPTTWQVLLDAGWQNHESITMLIGGEAVKANLKDQLSRLGTVFNLYGPTETTIWSMIEQLDVTQKVLIGKPIDNTTIFVVSKDGQLCPVNVPGEICIGGDGLARGYLNRPELTAEKFVVQSWNNRDSQRIYKTGDLGRWLANGKIEFLGRLDYQVKIRGYRIELGEIEAVLNGHTDIEQAVVTVQETATDKTLQAYLVPKLNGSAAGSLSREGRSTLIQKVREYIIKTLPSYMVPAKFHLLSKMPLTANGKIDKKSLAFEESADEISDNYVAPRNKVEEELASIWQELLGLEKVGINDNFFELGGHSLLAMKMVSYIERRLLLSIPIKLLFQLRTINDLAKYIATQQNGSTQDENPAAFELIDV